jgi:hypothetical protein
MVEGQTIQWSKDRQYNGRRKKGQKDKQRIDRQNSTQKTKDRATRTPLNTTRGTDKGAPEL